MTKMYPELTGYAVTVDFTKNVTRLLTGRIRKGRLSRDIHHLQSMPNKSMESDG
jgi:hypothetical protein